MGITAHEIVSTEPPGAVRRGIVVSVAVHVAALTAMFALPARSIRIQDPALPVQVVFLSEPPPIEPLPAPVVEIERPVLSLPEPPPPLPDPLPAPVPEAAPEPVVEPPLPEPPKVEPPRRTVQTQVFGVADPSAPEPGPARRAERTGVFGDGAAAAGLSEGSRLSSGARVGGFEVASAAASAGKGARPAVVRRGSFGDSAPRPVEPKPAAARIERPDTPVEILSKPTPIYTEEARRLRIEGEVEIEVVFEASGRLKILGVRRGLGHGLDEAALEAARHIAFKPAQREGRPVDHAAKLRVLFQLA